MDTQLIELIKSIRNRCDVCLMLENAVINVEDLERVFPTILEDIYEDSHEIIEKYCIVREDEEKK